MTLFETYVLQRIIHHSRRRARQQPKKRQQHMRTVTRCKRRLRAGQREFDNAWEAKREAWGAHMRAALSNRTAA